jgi:hypothetical protein
MQADVAADGVVDQPGTGAEQYRNEVNPKFVDEPRSQELLTSAVADARG